jgi:uncharacterized delta-60 repeat protein
MTRKERFTRRTGVRRLVHRYSVLLLSLLFAAAVWTGLAVRAADGDLDPTFDGDGIVTTTFTGGFAAATDLVIQPDGKIVAVGAGGIPGFFGNLDFAVARYNTDGSLDTTFGSGGKVATDLGDKSDGARGVAIQSDGKIVVVGRTRIAFQNVFAVARYNTDGSLDSTFGSGGIVTTAVGNDNPTVAANDVTIQSDGKIVVVGTGAGSSGADVFAVVRYNTDGSLDTGFGSGGVVTTSGGTFPATGTAVALQSDGKIVAAGYVFVIGSSSFDHIMVARYNTDGSLDTTFDSDGIVTTHIGVATTDRANGVALQSNGKIVVVGQSFDADYDFAVIRYNTDGSLDATFDGDGIVTTDNGFNSQANDVAIQSDGKIVVAGNGGNSDFAVARYNTNGSLDTTFGIGGAVSTTVSTTVVGGFSAAQGVAIQSDGKIVAAGIGNNTFDFSTFSFLSDFALVRYGSSGVVNHPPVVTITGPASGSIFAVGTPVNFTGTFTDDAGDTHTAEWMFDTITQAATVVEPSGSTPGSANTTYTFTQAGVYKVKLTVTDNGALSGTATTVSGLEALVVIYDPSAGWVTGGGWINSPPGAFAPIPSLTGKANFGFVSKYQNGASVPTGNTEFHFKAGDLKFKSTSYEWMVIAGARAQYKGVGTVNGAGSYRFMLTAIDGQQPGGGGADKFRIRIWSDGGGLVYDNQLSAPDSDDPTTVLGGGSIVIHK